MNTTQKKHKILSGVLKYCFISVLAIVLVIPTFTRAVFDPSSSSSGANIPDNGSNSSGSSGGANIPLPNNSTNAGANGVSLNTKIANPLGPNITDLPTFINVIVSFVLLVGIPIIVLAVIYAGFLFVTAQGNSEKLKKAKTTLLYTLIGAALLLGSFVIANAIKGTVSQITS